MKKISKIIFIGGNRYREDGPLIGFAKECQKQKIEVMLLVDKERINYPTETIGSFKTALKKHNIRYKIVKSIDKKTIKDHLKADTIAFSVNCRWIIRKDIIELMDNNVFNYHNSSLPDQRGAACHSWRLMQGKTNSHLTIHKINPGIDKGEIIIQKAIKFPKTCKNLMSTYKYTEKFEQILFKKFLTLKKYKVTQQNENNSFYWPRLDTPKHGLINWNWTANEIKLFCSAFDAPFKGASTFIDKYRAFFHDVELADMKTYFHPFQAGLVYRIKNGFYYIATTKGGIKIKEIRVEDKKNKIIKSFKIKLGHRFITPSEELSLALINKNKY